MEQLINITDAVFLGHVGEIELGASAIAGIYYLAIYMLGFGFSIGLQVMESKITRKPARPFFKAYFSFWDWLSFFTFSFIRFPHLY